MTIILTKDLNKNILRITYNFLNLPKEIMFMDGSYIHYTYDAAGTLLRKGYYVGEEMELLDEEPIEIPDIEYTEEESINPMAQLMSNDEPIEEDLEQIEVEEEILYTDVIDYCGNCIYENGTLKMILIEDGYVTFDSNSQPVYHFYLKDHLGNNRVVANVSGQVEQVNHYYPYGGLMAESTGGDVQRYKYNGKELDRMLGLDWYDYGARHYDGALTVWGTMDPLCEKYYNISPYVYCVNSPINAFDLDGRDAWVLIWATQSTDAKGSTRIGHTGVVVENFNRSYESKGTYTYYDLWPSSANLGGKAAVQNVDAVYNSQSFYILTNGEKNVDYSALEKYMSGHDMSQLPGMLQNNISENSIKGYGEGYAPDGIIRLGLDGQQSYQLQKEYISLIQQGEPYNGESNNCTTFVAKGINNSGVGTINEESIIDWRGIFINFNPFHKSFTPNATYNQLKNRKNSVIIKSAGNKTNECYEDAIIDR